MKTVDSDHQTRYHNWILDQLRKMDEQPEKQTFYFGRDQYEKSLADWNNLDSDRLEGG